MRFRFFHILGLAATLITAHLWALKEGLYKGKIWIDMPLHFGGGIFFGLVAIWALQKVSEIGFSKTFSFFFISSIALMGGFFWEIFELFFWKILPNQASLLKIYSTTIPDIISDLLFGLLGGIFIAVIYIVFDIIQKIRSNKENKDGQ